MAIQETLFLNSLLSVLLAFLLTGWFLPILIRIDNKLSISPRPNGRFPRDISVSNLGGIAITLSTTAICLLLVPNSGLVELRGVIGVAILVSAFGVKYDILDSSEWSKLLFEIILVCALVVVFDLRVKSFEGLFGVYDIPYFISIVFSLFLFITLISSIEVLDFSSPQLSTTILIIISTIFAFIFLTGQQYSFSILCLSLSGSLIILLLFGFRKKSKIHTGSSGLLFAGFILSSCSMKAMQMDSVSIFSVASLFSYPVFDVLRVFGIRMFKGQSPFMYSRDSFYQLLRRNRISYLVSLFIIILIAIGNILMIGMFPSHPELVFAVLFCLFLLISYILKWRQNRQELRHMESRKVVKEKMRTRKVKRESKDLHIYLGLKSNPFSRFSAEEETDYLDEIYYKPKYYRPLFSDIKEGHSRFILGARGVGKTALIIKLKKQLDNSNVFTTLIDEYENIPSEKNDKHFLNKTIQKLITSYCASLSKSPILIKRLKKRDKEKLAFIIENFFISISRQEYERFINSSSKYKSKNFWIRIYNFILKLINSALSIGVEVGGDLIIKAFGLSMLNTSTVYKEYFRELNVEFPHKTLEIDNATYQIYKEILTDLSIIIKNSGFEQVVILFDKLDEFKKLDGSIKEICGFLEQVLKDTSLLLDSRFALVFSLWNELKEDLAKQGVRFDKIKPIDVTWTSQELEEIINRRLDFFAINDNIAFDSKSITLNSILYEPQYVETILSLSSNSPRDLLRLLSSIYYEQANINIKEKQLSTTAYKSGIIKFIKEYDYYSIIPNDGKYRYDIIINLQKLRRINKTLFNVNIIAKGLGISPSTATSFINRLRKYGIIRESSHSDGKTKFYEIKDPKIIWIIENNINPWLESSY